MRYCSYVLLALVLLLFSCKKEDNATPSGGTKLAKIVSTDGSSTTTTFFTFDADGKLARWRQTESGGGSPAEEGFRIQRTAGGLVDKVMVKESHLPDSTTLLVSSSAQQYTSAQYTEPVFGTETKTTTSTFLYDNAGNITQVTLVEKYSSDPPDPKSRIEFTYANGNLTTIKLFRISGNTNNLFVQYNMQYDQKPNPLAAGAEWILLASTNLVFYPEGSANNGTQFKVKQDGVPEETYNITYTYNSQNLPVRAVYKTAGSQEVAFTNTYTYE